MDRVREIDLAKYGESLGPRVLGHEILLEVVKAFEENVIDQVIFNFEKIETISSGFSTELFGGLKNHLGDQFEKSVRFKFPSGPSANIIKSILFRALQFKRQA